jgi:hypothetical protein
MNDYSEHIKLPKGFFAKNLQNYQDWRFTWFREAINRAVDTGATQIDFKVSKNQKYTQLTVKDNGAGLNLSQIRSTLLCLNNMSGLLLFAHSRYFIHTRNLLISGSAYAYRIEPADDYYQGFKLTIQINPPARLAHFQRCCRILVAHFNSSMTVTLNGKVLNTFQNDYDHTVDIKLGQLLFSYETNNSNLFLWVRFNGLLLFRYYLETASRIGLDGVLDLNEQSYHQLKANHEAFNDVAHIELNKILLQLTI